MGYTQYWKHGTYRLDNGAFDDIEALLKVNLDDASAIVGKEAVDERVEASGRKYAWTLGDVFDFNAFSRRWIRTNAFGETAVFYDGKASLLMAYFLYDYEVNEYSYSEFCKPDHNMLSDATLCAVLIAVSMHNPDADISSDGNWDEDNWQAGAKLYELACGRKAECPRNVALECRTYFKGDEPANAWLSNGSPAYIHVYRDKANIYAPYDKALNGDYLDTEEAIAELTAYGYKAA